MKAFVEDAAGRAWARLRPLRNRGFRSRFRHDPGGPALVLSPHLDDAVIDCWSLLTAPGAVRVVNVFAGLPAPGSVSYYERLAGARDSAEHMRRRREEDAAALALAARAAVSLGFLARAHRRGRPEPSFRALDAALGGGPVSTLYAPAALGAAHPDHELVRSYALAVARQGVPVRLYADAPYCVAYGWPAWVTGTGPDSRLDVDAYWGPRGSRDGAEVVRLDPPAAAAKLAAMRTYRSEFAVLDRGPLRQLSNPDIHGFEVFWPAPDGAGGPRHHGRNGRRDRAGGR